MLGGGCAGNWAFGVPWWWFIRRFRRFRRFFGRNSLNHHRAFTNIDRYSASESLIRWSNSGAESSRPDEGLGIGCVAGQPDVCGETSLPFGVTVRFGGGSR